MLNIVLHGVLQVFLVLETKGSAAAYPSTCGKEIEEIPTVAKLQIL